MRPDLIIIIIIIIMSLKSVSASEDVIGDLKYLILYMPPDLIICDLI